MRRTRIGKMTNFSREEEEESTFRLLYSTAYNTSNVALFTYYAVK